MLKQLSNSGRDFKCGEVFCATAVQYSVNCCLCKEKVVFELFPAHFRNKHLGLDAATNCEEVVETIEPEHDPFAQLELPVKNEVKEEVQLPSSNKTQFLDEMENYIVSNDNNDVLDEDCQDVLDETVAANNKKATEQIAKQKTDFEEDDDLPLIQRKTKLQSNKQNNKRVSRPKRTTKSQQQNVQPVKSKEAVNDESQEMQPAVKECSNSDFSDFNCDFNDDDDDDYGEWRQTKHAATAVKPATRRKKHKEDMPKREFSCSICFEKCVGRKLLNMHYKMHRDFKKSVEDSTLPANVQVFKCSFKDCEEFFSTVDMLNSHSNKHKGVTCEICGRTFTQAATLAGHLIRHTGKRDFACDQCEYKAFTEKELRAHMTCHTGLLSLVCDICGRTCRNRGALTKHKRRHTGERPYQCSVCEKRFFTGCALREHAVSHTAPDYRPFECYCGVRTKTKKALRVHQKVHETEKPYECDQCGKAFAKERGLKSHMFSHDPHVVKSMKENTSRKRKQPISSAETVTTNTLGQDPFLQMVQNLEHHINRTA